MGLFSKKPMWMSKNEEKALKAVALEENQGIIFDIMEKAPLQKVKAAAAIRLTDQSVIAKGVKKYAIDYRKAMMEVSSSSGMLKSMNEILVDMEKEKCMELISKLTDKTMLKNTKKYFKDEDILNAIEEKMSN